MKKLIKSNPVAFALVLVFLVLIIVGVLTTKAATPGQTQPASNFIHATQPTTHGG